MKASNNVLDTYVKPSKELILIHLFFLPNISRTDFIKLIEIVYNHSNQLSSLILFLFTSLVTLHYLFPFKILLNSQLFELIVI